MRSRRLWALGVLGLLGLLGLLAWRPASDVVRTAVATGPRGVRTPTRTVRSLECQNRLKELRATVDALEPLEPLEKERAWMRGQATRVIGFVDPQPVPQTGPASEAAIRAVAERHAPGLFRLDCSEHPCLVVLEVPVFDSEGVQSSTDPRRAILSAFAEETPLEELESVTQVIGIEPRELVYRFTHAFADLDDAPIDSPLERRVRHRMSRLREDATGPPLFPVYPDPEAVPDADVCGPAALALEQQRVRYANRFAWLSAEVAHLRAIVAHHEGEVRYFEPSTPDALREEAVSVLADEIGAASGWTVHPVDCDEFPCVMSFSSEAPAAIEDNREVREGLQAAVKAAGAAPTTVHDHLVVDDAHRWLISHFLVHGELGRDERRARARMEGISEEVLRQFKTGERMPAPLASTSPSMRGE